MQGKALLPGLASLFPLFLSGVHCPEVVEQQGHPRGVPQGFADRQACPIRFEGLLPVPLPLIDAADLAVGLGDLGTLFRVPELVQGLMVEVQGPVPGALPVAETGHGLQARDPAGPVIQLLERLQGLLVRRQGAAETTQGGIDLPQFHADLGQGSRLAGETVRFEFRLQGLHVRPVRWRRFASRAGIQHHASPVPWGDISVSENPSTLPMALRM